MRLPLSASRAHTLANLRKTPDEVVGLDPLLAMVRRSDTRQDSLVRDVH